MEKRGLLNSSFLHVEETSTLCQPLLLPSGGSFVHKEHGGDFDWQDCESWDGSDGEMSAELFSEMVTPPVGES